MSATSTKEFGKSFPSSMGTMIEWYDFYIFGSLAVVISTKFSLLIILQQLLTSNGSIGFVVRPLGPFLWKIRRFNGRKYTFMVTLLCGWSNILNGCIPSYETIGFMAPVKILSLPRSCFGW
jgi:hypothetical protein